MKPKTAIILLAMILVFSVGFMYFLYTQLKPIQVVEMDRNDTAEAGDDRSKQKDIYEILEEERKIIEEREDFENINEERQRMLDILSSEQANIDIDAMRNNLEWTQEERDKMRETIRR
jgi:Tfp pilus assembly protein PilO